MNKWLAAMGIVVMACSSCAHESNRGERATVSPSTQQSVNSAAAPSTQPASRIVARVNGEPITLAELDKPLIAGYGLNVLLNLVQLDLVKQQAYRSGITITQADIDHERELTVQKMFGDQGGTNPDSLLDQFLAQQHISQPEFNLVIETNAYLRKLATPMVRGTITDQDLKLAFAALYGETVDVRDIQLANPQEVAEARRRLASGESFEQVAREMSRDPVTAQLGGKMPPFSRQSVAVPQAFKEAAFALTTPGQVSDAVNADGAYHLIQLIKRVPPKVVKFEDVKESVRKQVLDQRVQLAVTKLRKQFAQTALQTLEIDDPVLKKQFVERLNKQEADIQGQKKIREQWEKEREQIAKEQEQPATVPATLPTTERAKPQ